MTNYFILLNVLIFLILCKKKKNNELSTIKDKIGLFCILGEINSIVVKIIFNSCCSYNHNSTIYFQQVLICIFVSVVQSANLELTWKQQYRNSVYRMHNVYTILFSVGFNRNNNSKERLFYDPFNIEICLTSISIEIFLMYSAEL